MSVKGCGPKIGLALIGQLGEDAVAGAILAQDSKVLSRATGVGLRLAERIILELKDKMQEETLHRKIEAAVSAGSSRPGRAALADDLVDALVALGYKRMEAEGAADYARGQAEVVEDQLKFALRSLQK